MGRRERRTVPFAEDGSCRYASDHPVCSCIPIDVTFEALLIRIVRGLVAEGPAVRARSADKVTDIVQDLTGDDVALLAHLLIAARIGEGDALAQEAQLHALSELAEWHELPLGALARLSEVPKETVTGSEVEYMEHLRGLAKEV